MRGPCALEGDVGGDSLGDYPLACGFSPKYGSPETSKGRVFERQYIVTNQGGNRAADAPAGTDWTAITRRLVLLAVHRHRLSLEDAEQIAQDAVCRFFDAEYVRYEPDTHGDVARFLGSIVNGLVVNHRRHDAHGTAWLVGSAGLVDTQPSPEEHAMLAEHGRHALAKLRRRTKRDVLVMRLVEAILFDGIHGPTEQAKHLGVRIKDIYEAWRRLREHLEAISISISMGDT